jgi:ferredoxin
MWLTEISVRCKGQWITLVLPIPSHRKGETMAKSVVIDQEACTGCGTCAAIAEDCFELNEETEKALVKDGSACSEEQIQEAIDTCPEEAISWAG